MSLKLCGFSASNYYNKIKLQLLEKGIDFQEELVWTGNANALLVDRSPLGKVPFLDTAQGPISESVACAEYIETASLANALSVVQHCRQCNNFSEQEVCERCESLRRDPSVLCVVETPIDMNMVEQTLAFTGLYYVIMGRLSPLDGVGPKELQFDRILRRIDDGLVKEVVLATNYTNEGEATAHYLAEMIRSQGVRVSRIARGVPVGGELEYVDSGTLAQALRERRSYK